MPKGTLIDFVCLARTCILTDTLEMSTNRRLIEEMVTDLRISIEHHRHPLAPARLKHLIGVHVQDPHPKTQFILQRPESIKEVVA